MELLVVNSSPKSGSFVRTSSPSRYGYPSSCERYAATVVLPQPAGPVMTQICSISGWVVMGNVRGVDNEYGTVRNRENGCVRGARSVDNIATAVV